LVRVRLLRYGFGLYGRSCAPIVGCSRGHGQRASDRPAAGVACASERPRAATAAAFAVTAQGAKVHTIQCDGDTCAAIIGNQAYTVLVQKDAKGRQHFGVSAYVGH
jgi:hypothetical protein